MHALFKKVVSTGVSLVCQTSCAKAALHFLPAKFQPMSSGNLQETPPLDGKCPRARVATTG